MKKKVYWYGIRTAGCDLSIVEAKVSKETEKRITLDDSNVSIFCRGLVLKTSLYESWFKDRKEAVTEKLKMLEKDFRKATEGKEYAKNRLAEFKERENV